MLIKEIISEKLQDFILQHENEDPKDIVLKNKTVKGVPASFIADQISGRKKAKEKIPEYHKNHFIVFPPQVNLEQSSSQITAQFKADFIKQNIHDHSTGVDLTGGFGVDSFFFSRIFRDFSYVESDQSIFQIARHNHEQLGAKNIHHHLTKASDFVQASENKSDFVFIDPSRRREGNQKVNSLSQSEPNVVELQSLILQKTNYCLIKASPLFDIHLALKELKNVKQVIVVSVNNECKEVLFFQELNFSSEALIRAVNILADNRVHSFEFTFSIEKDLEGNFSAPLQFLYEPNASILKAGAFKTIARNYNLHKLHPNTHLYTSDQMIDDFQGRVFRIDGVVKSDSKTAAEFFPEKKANVMTRNYPLSVEELKKKLRLTDGGSKYLIGFTGVDKKYLVAAERINAH